MNRPIIDDPHQYPPPPSDDPPFEPDPPPLRKKRPKYTKRGAQRLPPGPRPAAEFAGLTALKCCDACTAEHCIISNGNYCAHPAKGGLQGSSMLNHDLVARFGRARKKLRHQIVDLRST